MLLCGLSGFAPDLLPPGLKWARPLGVWAFGGERGVQLLFGLACVAHAAEAAVALRIAAAAEPRNAGAWALQTLLLGYPSLRLLRQRVRSSAAGRRAGRLAVGTAPKQAANNRRETALRH